MVSQKVVVGIDPGLHGAIATWFPREQELYVRDMPVLASRRKLRIDEDALLKLLCDELTGADRVVIEKVGVMPKQGIASAGSFMRGAGIVVGACKMAAAMLQTLDVVELHPTKWKFQAGVIAPAGSASVARKKLSRERAMKLFPAHAGLFARVKDDGRAEASLLAWLGGVDSVFGELEEAA